MDRSSPFSRRCTVSHSVLDKWAAAVLYLTHTKMLL
jgi:hypothetical protein